MPPKNDIASSYLYKIALSVLLSIVGFFCVGVYNKMTEIQKDLVAIQVQLVEVQTKFISREAIKEIAKEEIIKYNANMFK